MTRCIVCSKEFTPKRKRDSGKYCSHVCYLKRSGLPLYLTKVCAYCKKEFQARSKLKGNKGKCCSLKCTSLYGWSMEGHRNATFTPCEVCGKPVRAIASRRAKGRGKYCDKKCYAIGEAITQTGKKMSEESKEKLRQQRIGKLNPAYIHGHNDNHFRYMAGFTRTLRNKIKERDNHTCQKCGATEKLDVHHKDSNPLHNNEENLTTLCHSCHMSHHQSMRNNFTRNK